MKSILTDLSSRKNNLLLIFFAGILSVILLNFPLMAILLFPFSMFTTYIHEACHGLAAILTGGSLLRFEMFLDTSGVAYTNGGIRIIVSSAGYLGSSIFGSLLMLAALKNGSEKKVLRFLGIFFLVFTILFARNFVAFFSGLFFSATMFTIIRLKKTVFISSFLAFLAVQTCFNSVENLFDLIFLSSSGVQTDAHNASRDFTFGIVHPFFFAISWLIISGTIFFQTIKFCLKK